MNPSVDPYGDVADPTVGAAENKSMMEPPAGLIGSRYRFYVGLSGGKSFSLLLFLTPPCIFLHLYKYPSKPSFATTLEGRNNSQKCRF